MTDALKIVAKVALIAVVTAAVLALLNSITIPDLDVSVIGQAIGTPLAVVFHYIPIMTVLYPVGLALLGFKLAVLSFRFAAMAWRWIFKVNE